MLDNEKQELLEAFSLQSDRLFELQIIRTDSFTGEIGEYVACAKFGLNRTDRVTQAVDAIDTTGKQYQVKAKIVSNGNFGYQITNVDVEQIDYLVIVYFDIYYNPIRIIRIERSWLPHQRNVKISRKFLNSITYDDFLEQNIKIPTDALAEMVKFGKIFHSLVENQIVGSRRIVGDIGELYARQHLGLILNSNPNEKGADAFDNRGVTYEIKTRRVYESGRRTNKSRRLNNLDGKTADMLVVVVLDKSFRCAGMWTVPMQNIQNPKSAHLQIVNTTPGVRTIVKSRIDWLNQ